MEILKEFYSSLPNFIPTLITLATVTVTLWIVNWVLLRSKRNLTEEHLFPRRLAMLLLVGVGIVFVVLSLPLRDGIQNQLLGLLGLLLTLIIALSSTTFVANAMAGIMLRTVRSFRPGDFVHVEEQFGRVTEVGLFHVEIQTEDRDLTTIPNLYMISHPIKVVRAEGTIVSARISLGYENEHSRIDSLLVQAAKDAKLREPFVQVKDLGDFSVSYRIAGFLPDVRNLLTTRSNLRKTMLDRLHGAGVEIVSPTFMNQRMLQEPTLPPESQSPFPRSAIDLEPIPENLIFDKAERAERLEQLREEHEELLAEMKNIEARLKEGDETDRIRRKRDLEYRRRRSEAIARVLKEAEESNGA